LLLAGAALLLFLLPPAACTRGGPSLASITGKIVYREMGIEEMPIRALRWDGVRWVEYATTRSTYHGAFLLQVPPGTYRIEARGAFPESRPNILLSGGTDRIEVPPRTRRIDRVRVELTPAGERE